MAYERLYSHGLEILPIQIILSAVAFNCYMSMAITIHCLTVLPSRMAEESLAFAMES